MSADVIVYEDLKESVMLEANVSAMRAILQVLISEAVSAPDIGTSHSKLMRIKAEALKNIPRGTSSACTAADAEKAMNEIIAGVDIPAYD